MKKALKKAWMTVDGYKTYTAAVLMVLLGIVQKDLQLILEGVTVAALRHGIS